MSLRTTSCRNRLRAISVADQLTWLAFNIDTIMITIENPLVYMSVSAHGLLRSSHIYIPRVKYLSLCVITHISIMSRMQIPAHSHQDHQSRLPSGFHLSIATNHQDRQIIITKPPPSLARPVAFKQGRQAGRQTLRACRSPRPTWPIRKPLANRAQLHAIKRRPPSHFDRTGRAVHALSIAITRRPVTFSRSADMLELVSSRLRLVACLGSSFAS